MRDFGGDDETEGAGDDQNNHYEGIGACLDFQWSPSEMVIGEHIQADDSPVASEASGEF